MTETKKAPADAGTSTSTNPINQLHNTTSGNGIQALCGKISDELYSKVRFPLRYARTVLSDQQDQYFVAESAGETLTDAAFVVYGYEEAYIRNDIAVGNVRETLEALEKIIDRLAKDYGKRGGKTMIEIQTLRQVIHGLTDKIQSPALLHRLYRLAEYLYIPEEGERR